MHLTSSFSFSFSFSFFQAREDHLSDTDFISVFGYCRAAYRALPKFKQLLAKKEHRLF